MIIVDDMISVLINYMIYSTSPKLVDTPNTAEISSTKSHKLDRGLQYTFEHVSICMFLQ